MCLCLWMLWPCFLLGVWLLPLVLCAPCVPNARNHLYFQAVLGSQKAGCALCCFMWGLVCCPLHFRVALLYAMLWVFLLWLSCLHLGFVWLGVCFRRRLLPCFQIGRGVALSWIWLGCNNFAFHRIFCPPLSLGLVPFLIFMIYLFIFFFFWEPSLSLSCCEHTFSSLLALSFYFCCWLLRVTSGDWIVSWLDVYVIGFCPSVFFEYLSTV